MKAWHFVLIAALLFVGNLHSIRGEDDAAVEDEEYAEADRAHLVVRKAAKAELVVQGRNVTIEIEVLNGGVATAYDVEVADAALPEGVDLVEGALSAKYDKITPGSSKKYSYTVVPTKGDAPIMFSNAKVTYKPEADSSDKTVGTSSFTGFYVITPTQEITRHALNVGRYVSLGICKSPSDWRNLAILSGLVGGFLGVNSLIKSVNKSTKDRKHKKALAEINSEIEKEQ